MFSFNINKRIDSALKKNKRNCIYQRLEDMRSIVIFFDFEDFNEIRSIAQDLEGRGKKVMLWTIQPKQQDEIPIILPENVRVVWQKDLSKLWTISPSVLKEFRELQNDTVIDLTNNGDRKVLYMLANTTANFIIGINEPEHKVYDFIVLREEEVTLTEIYEQIKVYLKKVRKTYSEVL